MSAPTEEGLVATPVLLVVWVGLLLAIVLVDVGSYLVAASRAQAAADAAALAAVSTDAVPGTVPPLQAARATATRNDVVVDRCDCRGGTGRAEVAVSVEVGGLFVPRVAGMRRVEATARAELTEEPRPGDDPER